MRNIWLAVIVLAWFSTQSAVAEEAGIKVLCSHFRESARFGDAFGFKWDSSTNIAVLSDLESFFLFSPSRFPDHRGKPSKEPSYVPVKVGAKALIRDGRWEESAAYVVEVAIDKVDSETVSITLSVPKNSLLGKAEPRSISVPKNGSFWLRAKSEVDPEKFEYLWVRIQG